MNRDDRTVLVQWANAIGLVFFGALLGYLVALTVAAPRQAEARQEIQVAAVEAVPSLEATCHGALVASRALSEQLAQVAEVRWGIEGGTP